MSRTCHVQNVREVMTKKAAKFLRNFGFEKGANYKPISLKRYILILTTAARWHGEMFARYIADCFDPEGGPLLAGYEDSCNAFRFNGAE